MKNGWDCAALGARATAAGPDRALETPGPETGRKAAAAIIKITIKATVAETALPVMAPRTMERGPSVSSMQRLGLLRTMETGRTNRLGQRRGPGRPTVCLTVLRIMGLRAMAPQIMVRRAAGARTNRHAPTGGPILPMGTPGTHRPADHHERIPVTDEVQARENQGHCWAVYR